MDALLAAMVRAEGGVEAFVRAVQCSVPSCRTFPEAQEIGRRTIQHALWDRAMVDPAAFVAFLSSRWAPVGAANDPTGLNAHWAGNVTAVYQQLRGGDR